MKTKISAAAISLLFLMSCGSGEQSKTETQETTPQASSNKMILKAYNNMYVVTVGDTVLVANQPDASKAEVFEKIDQGNGKIALKTAAGKFISDDGGKNHALMPNRASAGEWEQFEIVVVDGSKINLKSYTGKIVCTDGTVGDVLFATRDQASDWETFTVEPK